MGTILQKNPRVFLRSDVNGQSEGRSDSLFAGDGPCPARCASYSSIHGPSLWT